MKKILLLVSLAFVSLLVCANPEDDRGVPMRAQGACPLVHAPNNNVYAENGHEIGTYDPTIETQGVSSIAEGRWVQFENGKQTFTYKGGSLPGSVDYKYVTESSPWYDKFFKKIGIY